MSAILVIDAGNSSTTIALFNSETKTIHSATPVKGGISAGRSICAIAIRKVFDCADRLGMKISKAMLSSVTPSVNEAWERIVMEEAGLRLDLLSYLSKLPFSIGFPHPETSGADRLADMAAATLLYGAPALVIDIGTAVTYDLLSKDHVFFTGVIGPGPEILAKSLHDYTALLPLISWWDKEISDKPKDTEGAMLFGIDAGFTGALKETVIRLLPLIGDTKNLVVTGGFAERWASSLNMGFIADRDLTLKGIGLVSEGNY